MSFSSAANTREGEVYRRLLEKLEEARTALGGKVYDVLGELFEGHALRDLLVEAIRYGDRPDKKAELFRKVDGAVDVENIEKLVAERKLTSEGMNPSSVAEIREHRGQTRIGASEGIEARGDIGRERAGADQCPDTGICAKLRRSTGSDKVASSKLRAHAGN